MNKEEALQQVLDCTHFDNEDPFRSNKFGFNTDVHYAVDSGIYKYKGKIIEIIWNYDDKEYRVYECESDIAIKIN